MAIRASHFAATAVTAGVLAFVVLIAAPVLHSAVGAAFERRWRRLAWIALATTMITGVMWVAVEIVAMTERSLVDAAQDGLISVILLDTNFGLVCDVRLVLAVLLAIALACARHEAARPVALILAATLLGSLACTGHAVGTPATLGHFHLIGDALHLLAAGAWVGGLLPLGMMLTMERADDAWAPAVHAVVRRFSLMGLASVGTLIVTGSLNAWILVGSVRALTDTNYGRLLMVKLALFATMLAFAAVNRLSLTPRLARVPDAMAASQKLARNSTIELALGLMIFVVIGVLGELHPAVHLVPLRP